MSDSASGSDVQMWTEEARPCRDPECGGQAEPEQDGDHRYWSCVECGFDFGHERVIDPLVAVAADGSCSIGVPANVRKAMSKPMTDAMAKAERQQPVSLGLTIGRRPDLGT